MPALLGGSQLADGPLPPPPGGWDATASTTGTSRTSGLPYGGASSSGPACGTTACCVGQSDGLDLQKGDWIAYPDGSSASAAQNGCWGESTESLVRYQHAGQGRGSYEKVPTYTFVGDGRGSFDKEAIGADGRGCGQCACLVCVVVTALAVLAGLVALQAKDVETALMGAASGFKQSTEEKDGPSTAKSVDCEALVRKLEKGRDDHQAQKLDWCCKHQQKGCSHRRSTNSEPFDCEADYASWHSSWPTSKKVYCCHMYARACQADDHATYDCQAGFDNWMAGWSDIKRRYCCRTAQRGCHSITTEPYDCASGFDFWESAWSHEKKTWCCHTYRRGCKQNG